MSGGVDSSVAAYLLCQAGYDVVGLFMRTGSHAEVQAPTHSLPVIQGVPSERASNRRGCCSAADAADARRVADRLDIPFYALDFEREFDRIIEYFVLEYTQGRTPNPCVMCNNWLKFGRLWEFAQQIGAGHIATGHYARVHNGCLLRAIDPAKDQSYVLFGIRREILPHLLFPIGEYSKSEVRDIARKLGLGVADKPDSQEICFVPSDNYQQLIRQRRPEFDGAGQILDTSGQIVGEHDGFEGYTVGQRKGLGVALGERRYVVHIDAEHRRVVIGSRQDLLGRTLWAERVNWLSQPPLEKIDCAAKIRYLHNPAAATVTALGNGEVTVEFVEPQSAITPGQAVVFYAGDRVLGGGTIRLADLANCQRGIESDSFDRCHGRDATGAC
jgi:tRNA-specific 2-thiouridylase